jgi:hypothetical protein
MQAEEQKGDSALLHYSDWLCEEILQLFSRLASACSCTKILRRVWSHDPIKAAHDCK